MFVPPTHRLLDFWGLPSSRSARGDEKRQHRDVCPRAVWRTGRVDGKGPRCWHDTDVWRDCCSVPSRRTFPRVSRRPIRDAQTATQGSATFGEGLTDPPNWKVESADSAIARRQRTQPDGRPGSPVASVARYGIVNSSSPPFWGRKKVKPSATAQVNIPRVPSVQPPRATSLPNSGQQAKGRQQPALKVAGGGSLVAIPASRSRAVPVAVADEEHRALLRHAQFLIKAGLAPVAKEPLQQILREVPGTPIAREARLTLDSIQN